MMPPAFLFQYSCYCMLKEEQRTRLGEKCLMADVSSEGEKRGGAGAGRSGKRQIVCFLKPEQNHAARRYAQSMGLTRQSLLGRAINRHLASLGELPKLNDAVTRMVCMTNPRVRKFHNPFGRYGKSALAGWFSDEAVSEAALVLMKHGSNFQHAAVSGLGLLGIFSDEYMPNSESDDTKGDDLDSSRLLDSECHGMEQMPPPMDGLPDLLCRDNDFPDF